MSNKKNLDAGRYFDGEMSHKEQERFENSLSSRDSDRMELENISKISELFNVMEDEALKGVSFEGFDKRVMIAIKNDKVALSLFDRLSLYLKEFFTYKKVVWIPAGAVAAAGALFLVIGLNGSTIGNPVMPDAATPQIWKASAPSAMLSSEVKLINSSQVKGVEYNITVAPNKSIGVIWIDD
ncbi:MAG: hypothetical protein JXR91_05740 [Deltaproteobacteria bacterium]|nr:hypothetical protein [Deltaproteobacteria bacterium]